METKVCKVCGQELPLSEFKKSPFATNGIATCKKCVSDKIKKTNADLEGQLLSAKNLNDIEKYAVNALGMVKSNSGDITYVSYIDSDTKTAGNDQNDIAFLSWVSDLFN